MAEATDTLNAARDKLIDALRSGDAGMTYKRCLQFVGVWEAHLAAETSGSAVDPREGRQYMDCRDCRHHGHHTRAPGCILYEQEQIAAAEERPLHVCDNLYQGHPTAHACPDCGHRADAHTVGRSCDICGILRTIVMMSEYGVADTSR